jgi:hypothetical protein
LIRSFRLHNIVSLKKLQNQGQVLDVEERMVHPRSPLWSALLTRILPTMPTITTYLLDMEDETGHHCGLIQMRTRPDRPEQDVIFLAPSLEHGNGSHAVWQRLLTYVSVRAGEYGYHRVYGRLVQGSDEAQIFRNVGFSAYAEEEIYRLDIEKFPALTYPSLNLRKQTTADSWSLQRLYAAVTPRTVQIAEGLAQGQWQLNARFAGGRERRAGYVWEREGEILAALHIRFGKSGNALRCLIHPDVDDQIDALIETGLQVIQKAQPKLDKPIFSNIRTYQAEMGTILQEYGFEKVTTQAVMVKHNTVRAKDYLTRLVEAPIEAKAASPTPFVNADIAVSQKTNGRMRPKQVTE